MDPGILGSRDPQETVKNLQESLQKNAILGKKLIPSTMQDEYPDLESLQRALDRQMAEHNNRPMPEFDHLSPNQMAFILYRPFAEGSPIGFKPLLPNEVVDQIPFARLFRIFAEKIWESGRLKLTATGNLPRKTCQELYELGIIKEWAIEEGITKLSKETDSIVLQNLKNIGKLSGILKVQHNWLSLTKNGTKLLDSADHGALFQTLFLTNFSKFNLGYYDGFPQESKVQFTLGYTLYLLLKYGHEQRELQFYIDKNLAAFPFLLEDFPAHSLWSSPEEDYRSCYYVRVFQRFLDFYGFVAIKEKRNLDTFDREVYVRATDLYREVLVMG